MGNLAVVKHDKMTKCMYLRLEDLTQGITVCMHMRMALGT